MERMEKWLAGLKDRPLLQAALAAGAFVLFWLYAFLARTPYYTFEEITPELCEQILQKEVGLDGAITYIGKERPTYEVLGEKHQSPLIFAGYTASAEDGKTASAGLLIFSCIGIPSGEFEFDRHCDIYSLDYEAEKIYSYYDIDYKVILNTNPELNRIKGKETGDILLQITPNSSPSLYVIRQWEDGVYLRADGSRIF